MTSGQKFAVVGGLWLTLFSLGAVLGKRFSLPFEERDVVRTYVASRVSFDRGLPARVGVIAPLSNTLTPLNRAPLSREPQPAVAVGTLASASLAAPNPTPPLASVVVSAGTIAALQAAATPAASHWRFTCGFDQYSFAVLTKKLEVKSQTGAYQAATPERREMSAEDVEALAQFMGVPAGMMSLPLFVRDFEKLRANSWLTATVLGGLVGFGWGLMLGITREPSCDQVRKAVGPGNDDFWASLEAPQVTRFLGIGAVVPVAGQN